MTESDQKAQTRKVLLVKTRSIDPIGDIIAARQEHLRESQTKVIDLTEANPNYDALVQEIFQADSIHVF